MLEKTILRMIQRGQTDGLAEKLDVFFLLGKLTREKYEELTAMLPESEEG